MATTAAPKSIRTLDGIASALDWLYQQQRDKLIDAKSADGLNTTLKGAIYVNGKLRIDYGNLWMKSQAKKISFPEGMLPELPGGAAKS